MDDGPTKVLAQPLLQPGSEPGNERLDRYLDRTQNALDLVALFTLWIVVVPPRVLGGSDDVLVVAWVVRLSLSVLYGIDMGIRTVLARHRMKYLQHHVVGIVAVVFPPVRVLFSLRLIRQLFARGNLDRFLAAAAVLLLNGALIVYYYERDAAGANIHTVGESLWWAIVTVTTVGYGDYFPVTLAGKVTATLIMAIGIITVAVITAQVASSFVDQASRRASGRAGAGGEGPGGAPPADVVPVATGPAAADEPATPVATITLADLDQRLDRIERLVATLASSAGEPDDA